MRQYLDVKRQHRDAIVFFRMGDFYEMFYEDAIVAARALDLTLTSRAKDAGGAAIPMCGVPYHAVDGYLARMVKKGFRVAICEQVEDPRKAKGLVRRDVVRVVSPGTLHRRKLPRRPRAGLHRSARSGCRCLAPAASRRGRHLDGLRRAVWRQPLAWPSSTCRRASSRPPSTRALTPSRRLPTNSPSPAQGTARSGWSRPRGPAADARRDRASR